MNNCKGFSITEFLIAIIISSILLIEITTSYLSQKKSFSYTYHLALMQENARILEQCLSQDIHMAGFIGCGRLNEIALSNLLPTVQFTSETRLYGFHNKKTSLPIPYPTLLKSILAKAKSGTDILVIQEADAQSIDAYTNGQTILLTGKNNFKPKDILTLNNCNQAVIFRIKSSYANKIIPTETLQQNYSQLDNNQLSYFHTFVYYIANTDRRNLSRNPIYALYRRDLNGAATTQNEWLEGIDDMQITYGVLDPKTKILQYFTADQVPNWQDAKTVHIDVLQDSLESIFDRPHSYYFINKNYLAPDRRLYHEWNFEFSNRE